MPRQTPDNYSLSHSEMATFKECRRKWYLQYFAKLRRKTTPRSVARDTGILVHGALHVFYSNGGLEGASAYELMQAYLADALAEDTFKVAPHEVKELEQTHEYANIVLEGYFEWLNETGADDQYEFLESEISLSHPGPVPGSTIMGVLDLAGTHTDSGDLFVMDTKVVASIDDAMKTLHMNEQAPMYAVLSKINDTDHQRGFRVIWNFIKKTKQTARAKPPFYQRYELAINEDQLRQFWVQLDGQIREIFRTEQRLNDGESHVNVAYPTPSRDCTWKCPYFQICGLMNDPRNDVQWFVDQYYDIGRKNKSAEPEPAYTVGESPEEPTT